MAEAFGVVSGAVSVFDIAVRLCNYIRKVRAGAAAIDADLRDLLQEIERLQVVISTTNTTFKPEVQLAFTPSPEDQRGINTLWQQTANIFHDCEQTLKKLEDLIRVVAGDSGVASSSRRESILKFLRKDSKDSEFLQAKQTLNTSCSLLEITLTAINIHQVRRTEYTSTNETRQLAEVVRNYGRRLEDLISELKTEVKKRPNTLQEASIQIDTNLAAANAVLPLASINEYWGIPRGVSSQYTGREKELRQLREAYFAPPPGGDENQRVQRRFVIHGLGGSGKTEFCFKFAQNNRDKFWGVFWIDASSKERVRSTFSDIASDFAKLMKDERDERRAKSWLSQSKLPWLLIVDNADDPEISIADLFPGGDRGFILITTRNHLLKTEGTLKPGSYHFTSLEPDDGRDLLLRTAGLPRPWDDSTIKSASEIAEELGCLPLALILAGTAIKRELCAPKDYLKWYIKGWNRERLNRSKYGSQLELQTKSNIIVYSTYEAMYEDLELKTHIAARDALDLLRIFAFLHRENIDITIFIKSANNSSEVRNSGRGAASRSHNYKSKASLNRLRDLVMFLAARLMELGETSKLPLVLRARDENRLRSALDELRQRSLVSYDAKKARYSMHPLVHTWVRKRPGLRLGEQAVWCHSAATILSRSIDLEPSDDALQAEEDYRRALYSHIEHVRRCQFEIEEDLAGNRRTGDRWFRILQPSFDRADAMQFIKFSLVYNQVGLYEEAEEMQRTVSEFLVRTLGPENVTTMRVMLLLSGTIWRRARFRDAVELQEQVLATCVRTRGEDDSLTLRVKDALGTSFYQLGKYSRAKTLHEDALCGFKKLKGSEDVDTLRAMNNLGRILGRNCKWDEAAILHRQSRDGLVRRLGTSHLDTLEAQSSIAMNYLDRSENGERNERALEEAYELEKEVLDLRQKRLGKHHPYTLWAQCNLARIGAARGDYEEAVRSLSEGIAVAEADNVNLGPRHIGTLFGKLFLAEALISSGKHEPAKVLLEEVITAHDLEGRPDHPDQLKSMSLLIKSYVIQGNRERDIESLRQRIKNGLVRIGGIGHPWENLLLYPPIMAPPAR